MRVPRGFEAVYARGARGLGTFITAEQIDSIGPKDIKAMFQAIRGVVVTQHGVYFNRCQGNAVMWPEWAELWVDGDRVTRFNVGGDPSDPRDDERLPREHSGERCASDRSVHELSDNSRRVCIRWESVRRDRSLEEAVTVAVSGRRKHRTKRSGGTGAKDI